MLCVCDEDAGVIRFAQTVIKPRDVEEFGRSTFLGSFVGRRKAAQRPPAYASCDLRSPRWIDNVPRMHCSSHVPVATGTCDVEQSDAFHEEGSLLVKENRETLVGLNLECIAFDLAEVGVDGAFKRDRSGDPIFCADAHISFPSSVIPPVQIIARLVDAVRDARYDFEQWRLLQVAEYQMRMPIEDPEAWRNVRPCPRNAGSATVTPEQNPHLHFGSTGKSDRLQRHPHLDDITVGHDFSRAVPYKICFVLFTGCRGLERVHLNATWVREKVICGLAVSCGVETNTYPIVVERTVATA